MGKFYVPRHQTSNFTHQTKKGLVVERQVLFHYPQEGGFYEEIHGDTGFLYAFYGFFLSGCSLSPTNTGVLIGTNLALSGKGMSYSTSTERGIELAKDMVNDRGGLLGRPVQIVSVDNHASRKMP